MCRCSTLAGQAEPKHLNSVDNFCDFVHDMSQKETLQPIVGLHALVLAAHAL